MITRPTLKEVIQCGGPTPFGPGLAYGKGSPIGMSSKVGMPQDLWAWYKPESFEGMETGDPINEWPDSSGNGRNMDTKTGQPTCKEDDLNDWNCVVFHEGTGESLSVQGKNSTASEMTLFSVHRGWTATQAYYAIAHTSGAIERGMSITIRKVAVMQRCVYIQEGTPIRCENGNPGNGTHYYVVARHKTNLTELWVNGVLTEITDETENFTPCQVNDYIWMNTGGNGPLVFNFEGGIYARAIEDDEVEAVNTYLADKFAL